METWINRKKVINRLLKSKKKLIIKLKQNILKLKIKNLTENNPTNDVDIPYVMGTRLDENGEIVPIMTTARRHLNKMPKLQQC